MKLFSNLFSTPISSYSYNHSQDYVKGKIEELFNSKLSLLTRTDVWGFFQDVYSFTMLVTFIVPHRIKIGPALHGIINNYENGQTIVETKIVSSPIIKLFFWLSILFGLIYFIQAWLNSSFTQFYWGLFMIIVGPFFVNWIAGITNAVLRDRYDRFIHKNLVS